VAFFALWFTLLRASDDYAVGRTVQVDLEWSCSNGIFWPADGIERTGRAWWAGHDPVAVGNLGPTIGSGGAQRVSGTLKFLTDDSAVFTSAAGGTLAMTLTKQGEFFTADCRLVGP
jgi:hypothetical protein